MPRQNKTQATDASVAAYLAAIPDAARRADCEALLALMNQATGQPARLWGTAIVGFGSYRYPLADGRMGESCQTGFASRKGDISIYLVASAPGQADLLARLGKHQMAKACLRIRRLADVDASVLAQLVAASVAEVVRHHGDTPQPG
ncbi:MAG: hypothetical protein CFE45_43045 [Burkholderiales bacterium PBB5]|nr:MAG: hypothetical protein CFE45_43045 [Burkholderiales bacterium PBB5]